MMLTIGDLAVRSDFTAGPLQISPARRRLEGPMGVAHLQPIEMKVLLSLLDARGGVVTRDDLFASAWGEAIVGDESLNRAIARVRKVASETAPGAYDVETIPRTGYRLTGQVLDGSEARLAGRLAGSGVSRRLVIGAGAASLTALVSFGLSRRKRWSTGEETDQLFEEGASAFRRDTAEDVQRSIGLLKRAVENSPESARAWGLLACAYAVASSYASPLESSNLINATKRAAKKSLAIQPHEPNAEAALTNLEGSLQTRALSEARLRSVLSRDPGNGFALDQLVTLLQGAGYTRESSALNSRALAIDPLAPVPLYRRALKLWILGRVSEADQVIERARELWPSHPAVWNAKFLILAFTRRTPAALSLLEDEVARPATFTPVAASVWRTGLTALDAPTAAKIESARSIILQTAGLGPGLAAYGAMIMSTLGDVDSAYRIIRGFLLSKGSVVMRPDAGSKRVLVNYPGWRETQWLFIPPTAGVRNDARFETLAQEIGLQSYWRSRGVKPDFRNPNADAA